MGRRGPAEEGPRPSVPWVQTDGTKAGSTPAPGAARSVIKAPAPPSSPPARPPWAWELRGHRIETVSSTMTLGCVRLSLGVGNAGGARAPGLGLLLWRDSLAWKLGLQGQHELPSTAGNTVPLSTAPPRPPSTQLCQGPCPANPPSWQQVPLSKEPRVSGPLPSYLLTNGSVPAGQVTSDQVWVHRVSEKCLPVAQHPAGSPAPSSQPWPGPCRDSGGRRREWEGGGR